MNFSIFCCSILQELVEYYQSHSLKESFKLLDTTLRYPYKSRERSLTRASTRSPGKPTDVSLVYGSFSHSAKKHLAATITLLCKRTNDAQIIRQPKLLHGFSFDSFV